MAARTLTISVIDTAGEPQEGVELSIYPTASDRLLPVEGEVVQPEPQDVTTDANGEATVTLLPSSETGSRYTVLVDDRYRAIFVMPDSDSTLAAAIGYPSEDTLPVPFQGWRLLTERPTSPAIGEGRFDPDTGVLEVARGDGTWAAFGSVDTSTFVGIQAIRDEETARATADDTLETAIGAERAAREAADLALNTRLVAAEGEIDTLQTSETAFEGRLATAESEIDALQTTQGTQNVSLISQGARLTTAEGEIDTLQTQQTANTAAIAALGSGSGGAARATISATAPTGGSQGDLWIREFTTTQAGVIGRQVYVHYGTEGNAWRRVAQPNVYFAQDPDDFYTGEGELGDLFMSRTTVGGVADTPSLWIRTAQAAGESSFRQIPIFTDTAYRADTLKAAIDTANTNIAANTAAIAAIPSGGGGGSGTTNTVTVTLLNTAPSDPVEGDVWLFQLSTASDSPTMVMRIYDGSAWRFPTAFVGNRGTANPTSHELTFGQATSGGLAHNDVLAYVGAHGTNFIFPSTEPLSAVRDDLTAAQTTLTNTTTGLGTEQAAREAADTALNTRLAAIEGLPRIHHQTLTAGQWVAPPVNGFEPTSAILSAIDTSTLDDGDLYMFTAAGHENRWAIYIYTPSGLRPVTDGIEIGELRSNTQVVTRIDTIETNVAANAAAIAALNPSGEGPDLSSYATVVALTAETTARTAADTTLQGNIDAEITARTTADTTLQTNIGTEQAAREAADTALNTRLTAAEAEIDTLQAVEAPDLSSYATTAALTAETTARTTADTNLNTSVTNERNARIAEDTALQTRLTAAEADIDTLQAVEAPDLSSYATTASLSAYALTTALNEETTNRTRADTTLQTNIDTEQTAREAADTALNTRLTTAESEIDTLQAVEIPDISGLATSAALATETTARQNGDTTITNNLNLLVDRVTATESEIDTLQAIEAPDLSVYATTTQLNTARTSLAAADGIEQTAREAADTALNTRLTAAEAEIDTLQSASEVAVNVTLTLTNEAPEDPNEGDIWLFQLSTASDSPTLIQRIYDGSAWRFPTAFIGNRGTANPTSHELTFGSVTQGGSTHNDVLAFRGSSGTNFIFPSTEPLSAVRAALDASITATTTNTTNITDLTSRLATAETEIDTLQAIEAPDLSSYATAAALTAETTARTDADTTLQTNIGTEQAAREAADTALNTRLTTAEADIDTLETTVAGIPSSVTDVVTDSEFTALAARVTTAEGEIDTLQAGGGGTADDTFTSGDSFPTNPSVGDVFYETTTKQFWAAEENEDGDVGFVEVTPFELISELQTALGAVSAANTALNTAQATESLLETTNNDIVGLGDRLTTAETDIDTLETTVAGIPTSLSDAVTSTQLAAETTARTAADTTLQTNIDAIGTRMTTAETDIDNLETTVAGIPSSVTDAVTQSELDAAVDGLVTGNIPGIYSVNVSTDDVDLILNVDIGRVVSNEQGLALRALLPTPFSSVADGSFIHYRYGTIYAILRKLSDPAHTRYAVVFTSSLVSNFLSTAENYAAGNHTGIYYITTDGEIITSTQIGGILTGTEGAAVEALLPRDNIPPEGSTIHLEIGSKHYILSKHGNNEYLLVYATSSLATAVSNIATLQTQVAAIPTSVTDAVTTAQLTAETTARTTADTTLTTNLDALTTRVTTAEGEIDTLQAAEGADLSAYATTAALTAETDARTSGDDTLTTDLNALTARVTTAEGEIDTLQAAEGADLSSYATVASLTAETTAREAADTTLQTNIGTEQAAREAADTALNTRLTAAEADIDTLQAVEAPDLSVYATSADLTALTTRVTTAEGDIDTLEAVEAPDLSSYATTAALTTERTERTTADTNLQTNIANEATARANADTALAARVTTLEGVEAPDLSGYATTSALTAETDARTSGDATLTTDLNALTTRVTTAETDIDTLESTTATNTASIAANAAAIAAIDTSGEGPDLSGYATTAALTAETTARTTADTTLQTNIGTEQSAREAADTALNTRLTTAESEIDALETASAGYAAASDLTSLTSRVTTAEGSITTLTGQPRIFQQTLTSGQWVSPPVNGFEPTAAILSAVDLDTLDNGDLYIFTASGASTRWAVYVRTQDGLQPFMDGIEVRELRQNTGVSSRMDTVETSLTSLTSRVTTAESDIDALEAGGGGGTPDLSGYATTDALTAETTARTAADTTLTTDLSALTTRVTTAEGEIDALETAGSGYASATDLTSLTSRVGTNETNIGTNSSRLTTFQSGLLTTTTNLANLTTRVTTAEGEIDALETAGAGYAAATDLTALTTRVTTAEGEIDTLQSTLAPDLSSYATTAQLTTERTERTTADTNLQTNIANEATARAAADTTLTASVNTKVTGNLPGFYSLEVNNQAAYNELRTGTSMPVLIYNAQATALNSYPVQSLVLIRQSELYWAIFRKHAAANSRASWDVLISSSVLRELDPNANTGPTFASRLDTLETSVSSLDTLSIATLNSELDAVEATALANTTNITNLTNRVTALETTPVSDDSGYEFTEFSEANLKRIVNAKYLQMNTASFEITTKAALNKAHAHLVRTVNAISIETNRNNATRWEVLTRELNRHWGVWTIDAHSQPWSTSVTTSSYWQTNSQGAPVLVSEMVTTPRTYANETALYKWAVS